jgi:hypothetical protein
LRRLLLSLVGGAACAGICAAGKILLDPLIAPSVLLSAAIGNRILIGFVIGISRVKINYILHGALIGLIVTLSYALGTIPQGLVSFLAYTLVGVVYGILIELFVTKGCGAGMAT